MRAVVALAIGMFCVQVDFFALSLTIMVTIAGLAVAVAGTLIELGGAGPDDIDEAAQGLLRMLSGLSVIGGPVLLAIILIGRRIRGAEVARPTRST